MTPDPEALPPEIAAALEQLDDLIQMFVEHPDESVQDGVLAVLRAVDVLHRGALQRLGTLLEERSLLQEAMADQHIALLFGLYESQPFDDERTRTNAAVERIRPQVEAEGGRLEVVAAEGGVVTIQLLGRADSSGALRAFVEEALRAELPDFVRMEVSSARPEGAAGSKPPPVMLPTPALAPRGAPTQPQERSRTEPNERGFSRGA